MNLIRKSIPNSGGIKSKNITRLFDRFMNRGVAFDKEITTNLTLPGIIRTAAVTELWSKKRGKISMKKLVVWLFEKLSNVQQEAKVIP